MKIDYDKSNPKLVSLRTVGFGKLVRVWELPVHWPKMQRNRNGRFGNYFLLTNKLSDYNDGDRRLTVVDVSTGALLKISNDHQVEVITNAEVVLNEDH